MKGMIMLHSTVTKRGQTTIPSPVREALHIQPGDKLEYDIQGSQVIIRVHQGTMALQGALASSKGSGLTFVQIRQAAAEARRREWERGR
jgi:AbrB family looped-hinge helix DNA binding protein